MNDMKISGSAAEKLFPRVKTIACCVSVALAQWTMLATPAHADSAVGANTTLGNASNPAPINPTLLGGDGGAEPGANLAKHTPTGQLYGILGAVSDPAATISGSVDVGAVGVSGDQRAAGFKAYKDIRSGLAVDNISLQVEKPDSARFFEATGSGVGRDDQFYGVQFGRYNDWRVKAFYNEQPHVFTSEAHILWDGAGSGRLSLPGNIPAAAGTSANSIQVAGFNYNPACSATSGSGATTGFTTTCYTAPAFGVTTPSTGAVTLIAINKPVVAAVAGTLATKGAAELGMLRKTGGVSFDINLSDNWKFYSSYSLEKRKGARPFGAEQGGGGGAYPMEIVEPIDYDTHDFRAGLRYADKLTQVNLSASASYFRNNIGELVFDVPYLVALAGNTAGNANSATLVRQGRFDLVPNNDAYNFKGEYARSLPELLKGRFTAVAAVGSSRQNDNLLAPVVNSGNAGAGANAVTSGAGAFNNNMNEWNTTAALSQPTANAKIDTKMFELGLTVNPASGLSVAGKVRHFETENSTFYMACNPIASYANGVKLTATIDGHSCTGVWGRLVNDGGGNAFVNPGLSTQLPLASPLFPAPAAGTLNNSSALSANAVRNVPWDYKQDNYTLSGDYGMGKSSFNLAFERENFDRSHREREKTWENKFKLGYTNRGLADATVRLSLEDARRRGSEYQPTEPYDAFNALSFFDPTTIKTGLSLTAYADRAADQRKYDLADRDQTVFNARVNYMLRENLDLGVSGQLKQIKYPDSLLGRNGKQRQDSLNLDLGYQPSAEQNIFGYYSYQSGEMHQNEVTPGAVAAGAATPAGPAATCNMGQVVNGVAVNPGNAEELCASLSSNLLFQAGNMWGMNSKDKNQVFGIGLKQDLGKNKLDLNLTHATARTQINYTYQTIHPQVSVANLALIGTSAPDLTTDQTTFSAALLVPINKQMSTTFSIYHEIGKIRDWHYQGLSASNLVMTTPNSFVGQMLDAGPQDYKVTVIGISLRVKL